MLKDASIVIYQSDARDVELQTDLKADTIWASEKQIASVFMTTRQNVNLHLKNLYKEGELSVSATCKDSLRVRKEGEKSVRRPITLYNLDVIIAVGYRINSKKATQFRIWATKILREYLVHGHVLNRHKLEKDTEALIGLYDAVSLLESEDVLGKLKGKITIRLTKDLEPRK
jgi:hypothetical protein